MPSAEIEHLIRMLARLPGLGPRSGRRAALHLIKHRDTLLEPLSSALLDAMEAVRPCRVCGNLDTVDPCSVCTDPRRDQRTICVVEGVSDLWALERTSSFKGCYHVLGGTLSALDGRGPDDLRIAELMERVTADEASEIILALPATVEGQTTAHYVSDRLAKLPSREGDRPILSRLAHGLPVGGELDYLDDGTLSAALNARRPL